MDTGNEEYLGYQRRLSDAQQEKIDELIAEEVDPRARLTLTVMANINRAISANTSLIHELHREVKLLKIEVEAHITENLKSQNQNLGSSRVLKLIGPIVWSVLTISVGTLYLQYDTFRSQTIETLASIGTKLEVIQTKINLIHYIPEDGIAKEKEAL